MPISYVLNVELKSLL